MISLKIYKNEISYIQFADSQKIDFAWFVTAFEKGTGLWVLDIDKC